MSGIAGLGYLGIGVSNLPAWEDFATNVLGLQVSGRDERTLALRMDEYRQRFVLHAGGNDDVAYVGWEVRDAAAMQAVASRLRETGIKVEAGSAEEAAARGVTELAKFDDPNGLATEIFYGPLMRFEEPFHSPRAISGFVTGEQGLGHIVLAVRDLEQSLHFYRDILGFRISDFIDMSFGPMKATLAFFHCNARHHSLAIIAAPLPKRLLHFMLQTKSVDDVGSTLYLAQDKGVEIASSLGRHTNDHMLSFYMRTPSGFEVEYGWGARTVDDAVWHVQRHQAPSIWGHRREAGRSR
ncbi:MAG: biphenyl-2,3-diol 1,2-dioxygenase [Candidatus Binatus sp.]|uniref:biphenyl-2,3-diol 1,2-dioxygenase n=1 Tax=Candidatus Binatus sp. TaxID=2811406 RepID=UPI00272069BE|nr:biphenyl-2,3-diol 1,2-dioxygenase [Candidatus Binatus sp.]MDO8434167.1 biphenyl-2,3-diol 1,2-dioxygenase [Candidatus Binatus sp.]